MFQPTANWSTGFLARFGGRCRTVINGTEEMSNVSQYNTVRVSNLNIIL